MFERFLRTRAFDIACSGYHPKVREFMHKEHYMGIGASILLLALGAILAFAVQIDNTPAAGISIDWSAVGVILMIVGAVGLAWSIMALNAWRDRGRGDRLDGTTTAVRDRERIVER